MQAPGIRHAPLEAFVVTCTMPHAVCRVDVDKLVLLLNNNKNDKPVLLLTG